MGRLDARLKALEQANKEPTRLLANVTYTDGREYNMRPVEGGWAVVKFGRQIISVVTREAWDAL
jgi:hypothetical protein